MHVAAIVHEPVFAMADDFKNFFNQLKLAPEDYWKCGMVLSDLAGPVYAAEYIMTFGLRPASNIAQRFADAILWVFRRRMIQAEIPFLEAEEMANTELARWRRDRACLESTVDQTQLFAAFIYTDDPALLVVGAQRMARALAIWVQLTDSLGLIMASANKRQCGSHVMWLGAGVITTTGYAWIPKEKILRCTGQLQALLE